MKRFFVTFFAIIAIIFVVSVTPQCSDPGCSEIRWGYAYHAFNRYEVQQTSVTESGIVYDPSGLQISPALIDRLTFEVESCLTLVEKSNTGPSCMIFHGSIARNSFVIKIASDWVLSCDKSEQLLPVYAGSEGCIEKGITPTEQCPCRWRAGIKCPNVLIVTPSFYLYKDALIRFVTGCQNPWASPALASCATPSTLPLSDGTDQSVGP